MKISLAQPDITDLERKAVIKVLKTPNLSLGPELKKFENKITQYARVKYAVAVNSGTSALHLAIRALDIKDKDEVITTPFSFISSSNCILYERAKPVFVDIRPDTLNIDTDKIEEKITKKTRAILAVDVFGHPADWDKLIRIAQKYGLYLIEDSAEALGSEYKGRKCGSFGDAAIFSFYPNKQITTGEGGVIVTNNKKIADLCRSIMNQGREEKNNKWFKHIRLGYNYRMPEVCAAMGSAQLERINEIFKKRKNVANIYNKRLKNFPKIKIPYVAPNTKVNWFVYTIRLNKKYSRNKRDKIIERMKKHSIQCGIYFQSIHLQPHYKKIFNFKEGDFPMCEDVAVRTISLPFYNNLKEQEIDFVVKAFKKIINGFK